jgi:hypothetical protein
VIQGSSVLRGERASVYLEVPYRVVELGSAGLPVALGLAGQRLLHVRDRDVVVADSDTMLVTRTHHSNALVYGSRGHWWLWSVRLWYT